MNKDCELLKAEIAAMYPIDMDAETKELQPAADKYAEIDGELN